MSTHSKRLGYARVSTSGQDADRQEFDLLEYGVRPEDLYVDHGITGKTMKRPALDKVLGILQEGDELVVATLDRLGRTGTEMAQLVFDLHDKGVKVTILNLGGDTMDTGSVMGRMLIQVLSAIAEAEHGIKQERINDSIQKRREQGGDLGGRPSSVSDDTIRGIQRDIEAGMSVAEACRAKGRNVSRPTYYRRIKALALEA